MSKEDLRTITIDFEKLRSNNLNESFIRMFSYWVKKIMGGLLGDFAIPVKIKGTPSEVKSFVGVLAREKSYIEAYRRHGLDNPNTFHSKSKLRSSVRSFERETGLKWPFEH